MIQLRDPWLVVARTIGHGNGEVRRLEMASNRDYHVTAQHGHGTIHTTISAIQPTSHSQSLCRGRLAVEICRKPFRTGLSPNPSLLVLVGPTGRDNDTMNKRYTGIMRQVWWRTGKKHSTLDMSSEQKSLV